VKHYLIGCFYIEIEAAGVLFYGSNLYLYKIIYTKNDSIRSRGNSKEGSEN